MGVEVSFFLSCDVCEEYLSWNSFASYASALGLAQKMGWYVYDYTDPDSRTWKYKCHVQCPVCRAKNVGRT